LTDNCKYRLLVPSAIVISFLQFFNHFKIGLKLNVTHVTRSYENPEVVCIFHREFQVFFPLYVSPPPPLILILKKASIYHPESCITKAERCKKTAGRRLCNMSETTQSTPHIHNIMAHSHFDFCYGKSALHSLCIVVDVTINNIKPVSGATDMQEWVPVALLLSYKIFCTVVSNVNLGIYVNCPIFLSNFKTKFLVYANDVSILGTYCKEKHRSYSLLLQSTVNRCYKQTNPGSCS